MSRLDRLKGMTESSVREIARSENPDAALQQMLNPVSRQFQLKVVLLRGGLDQRRLLSVHIINKTLHTVEQQLP